MSSETNGKKERSRINTLAFWPSFIIAVGFILLGITNQEVFGQFLNASLDWISVHFGWLYLLSTLSAIIFVLILAFSRIGDIKFGGPEAKPEYTLWQWFSMSLCGGIGTGILFWAMGEPIFHMAGPPVALGAEPFSREAGIFAVSQTILHWTLAQYALYSICGVCIGLMAYNRHKALTVTSIFEPFVPKRYQRSIKTFISAASIFCIAGAVSCSMAAGLMQIGSGLDFIFGIPANKLSWFLIAAAIIGAYVISAVSGIKKGMRILSSFCARMFIILMFIVLLGGPTLFILNIGTEAMGDLLNNVFSRSVILPTMADHDTWPKAWIIQFMASFAVYAPLIGLFLSRMARGRTVRQFILMNIFAPSIFCAVWISIWGGSAVYFQHTGIFNVWEAVNSGGMESTIFTLLQNMPFGYLLSVLFMITIFASFATLADPMASTMATLSTKGLLVDDEAPKYLKIVWGCTFGLIAYLLVASKGADAVRGLFSIVGLPMLFMIIFYVICLIKEGGRLSKMKDGLDFRSDEAVAEERRENAEKERREVAEALAATPQNN
jgi:choline-glycine betaine transporter